MLPSVEITKVDGGTGTVRPSAVGVLALIAAASSGALNSAGSFARRDLIYAEHGHGHLLEFSAYVLPVSKKPLVVVRGDPATAGAYGSFTTTGGGTSVASAGVTEPVDDFDVQVEFILGATIGVAGATYRYSLNGGETNSKVLALGTANTITIPDTGVTIAFAAGTVLAAETVAFQTTAPKLTNADLPDSLEALRVTSSPWDALLIDMEADDDTVGLCDLWLKELNRSGKFKTAVLTARPRGAAETETEYKDALDAIFTAAASTDVLVCADRGDLPSVVRGISMPRASGLGVAARGMSLRYGVDPAFVDLGPIPGFRITDERNNPKYHDEAKYPGLDDLRLTTFRTIEGFEGVYITNANLLSAHGSDFVYWQHARCINRGAELAYQVLTRKLSKGVRKEPKAGPNGERYIAEAEAQQLEELVNAEILRELVTPGEVDDMRCIVSRTDDIRSNAGARVRVSVQSVSLGYVKTFDVGIGFVTAIEAPSPAT